MNNNLLDKFFKDTLSHLDGGDASNTWDMLSDRMDSQTPHSPIEDYAFDQKIKDAISSISVIEMPAWQNFVPSLDLEDNLIEIESDIALDESISSSLKSLDAEYDAASWDTLANRLDEVDSTVLENQDATLDQVSYEKLLNFTVPQKAGDWEVFNRELDKEFVLPYKLLFKYKIAEVAILASLILIFFQAQPHIQNHFEKKKFEKTAHIAQKMQTSASNSLNIADEIKDNNNNNNNNNNIGSSKEYSNAMNNSVAAPIKNSSSLSLIVRQDDSINSSNLSDTIEHNNSIASTNISSNEGSSIVDNNSFNNISSVTAIVKSTNEQIPTEATPPQLVKQDENSSLPRFENLLGVDRLPAGALMNIPFAGDVVTACFACNSDNTILRWRLGAHLDGNYTYIMTPYDNILNLKSYNHATLGYGAGLSTSFVLDKWELESGFNFISRQYTPKAVQNVGNVMQGFLAIEISKIQMNVLSVPLNLRYHFNDKRGKTHFYMHGGATMHIATQLNHINNSNFVGSNKRPGLIDSKILFEESDIISDKIFTSGWFDGGSYIENRYLTVNLGLGFERKISSRYSIFGQTTYAQYLDNKGIGANNDRFNSVEFSTGVRALFK